MLKRALTLVSVAINVFLFVIFYSIALFYTKPNNENESQEIFYAHDDFICLLLSHAHVISKHDYVQTRYTVLGCLPAYDDLFQIDFCYLWKTSNKIIKRDESDQRAVVS